MFKFETSVLNSEGQPIVGATVSIFATGTNTLVQLFDDDQITTKFNPLTTDNTGLVQCKAANGKYDYLVGNLPGGATRRINGIIFDDPAEGGSAGIAVAMPGEFTVAGSPGNNITVTKKTQVANTGYFGPTTGVAATPTFRAMVSEDMPIATPASYGAALMSTPATLNARDGTRVVTGAQSERVKLATFTASNSASTVFDSSVITDNFKRYEIEVIDAVSATDAVGLQLLLSTDNGATYLSSYRMWFQAGTSNGTGTTPGNNSAFAYIPASGIAAGTFVGNAAGRSWNGLVKLRNLRSALTKKIRIEGEWDTEGGFGGWIDSRGFTNVTNAINNVKMQYSSGNITSGVFVLYGIV